MGAHLDKKDGKVGAWFTVWAPHAAEVSVIGEFNGWDAHANVMRKVGEDGVYEVFIPGVTEGMMYKYYIRTPDGRELYKADPYAFASEKRPGTASKVAEIEGYRWGDSEWLTNRKNLTLQKSAPSIYEVHPGSWTETSVVRIQPGRILQLRSVRTFACRLRKKNGLYPRRADGNCRASV